MNPASESIETGVKLIPLLEAARLIEFHR